MLVIDLEQETEVYDNTQQTEGSTETESAEIPISDAERIEALEAAVLELAEVVLNG